MEDMKEKAQKIKKQFDVYIKEYGTLEKQLNIKAHEVRHPHNMVYELLDMITELNNFIDKQAFIINKGKELSGAMEALALKNLDLIKQIESLTSQLKEVKEALEAIGVQTMAMHMIYGNEYKKDKALGDINMIVHAALKAIED